MSNPSLVPPVHDALAVRDAEAVADQLELTPLRAHYLKKELLRRAVGAELAALARPNALSLMGPPFAPPSPNAPPPSTTELPILRFLFQHFVLTFPLLRTAPPNFYSEKVQGFAEQLLASNLSSSGDRQQDTKRRRIALRLQRYFVLLLSSALATKPAEQVVRLTAEDSQRLAVSESRVAALARGQVAQDYFDVNIIAVRLTSQRGIVSRKTHELFLIRTQRGSEPESSEQVIVARRYGDFVRLADTLRTQFPETDVPSPPAKDRSHVRYHDDEPSDTPPVLGGVPRREGVNDLSSIRLSREKNRLTLRAYLKALLANSELADSSTMRDFLTQDPTELTTEESRDAAAREALDVARQSEAARFAAETTERVQALQSHLTAFKADLVQPDGLARVFATIKRVPQINQLPPSFRAVVAWAKISAASTLFHMFRRGDRSSELLAQLKHIHSMMPYQILKGILKVSNPVAMIRAGLDLFLAQPFGQKSLIQRMFLSGISEELKQLTRVEQAIEDKIADPDLSNRVHTYTELEPAQQDAIREQGQQPGWDLMTSILRSSLCGSPLTGEQRRRCTQASASYARYTRVRNRLEAQGRLDEDPGPPDESAWLYEDLHVLLRTSIRIRDKEQMYNVLSDGVTANLLKDVVTIFYAPLAQVYKAANIADSLGDLQSFVSDLIATVERLDSPYPTPTSAGDGAQHTVQTFIDLVGRHEQSFYTFVHNVHSRGAGLFDGLMDWMQRIINFVRGTDSGPESPRSPTASLPDGPNGPNSNIPARAPTLRGGGLGIIDLEVLLPAGPTQRAALLAEADALIRHAYQTKLVREAKVRRKLVRQRVANAADQLLTSNRSNSAGQVDASMDEWDRADDAAFSAAVMKHLGFGGAVRDEVVDATLDSAADSDEGSDLDSDSDSGEEGTARADSNDEDESEYRGPTIVDAWGNRGIPAPIVRPNRSERSGEPAQPELTQIPDLLPMFLELLKPLFRNPAFLPPSRQRQASIPASSATSWGSSWLGGAVGSTISSISGAFGGETPPSPSNVRDATPPPNQTTQPAAHPRSVADVREPDRTAPPVARSAMGGPGCMSGRDASPAPPTLAMGKLAPPSAAPHSRHTSQSSRAVQANNLGLKQPVPLSAPTSAPPAPARTPPSPPIKDLTPDWNKSLPAPPPPKSAPASSSAQATLASQPRSGTTTPLAYTQYKPRVRPSPSTTRPPPPASPPPPPPGA